MKTIPVNKWTITGAVIASILLITIGSTSAGTPETKTKTVTEYKTKTKEIKGDTVYKLSDTCRKALVSSTQNMADFNNLVGAIGDAIVTFSETYSTSELETAVARQQVVIDGMLSAVKQTMACDPTIGQDVTIPGQ
jgi:hypothetical protein